MATVPQTEQILLSYFQTGDQPTQDQFEELVSTQYRLNETAQDGANSALALVNILIATTPKVVGRLEYDPSTNLWTTYYLEGATVAFGGTENRTVTVTFNTAFTGATDYSEWHDGSTATVSSVTQTADTIIYVINDPSSEKVLEFILHGPTS